MTIPPGTAKGSGSVAALAMSGIKSSNMIFFYHDFISLIWLTIWPSENCVFILSSILRLLIEEMTSPVSGRVMSAITTIQCG